MTFHRRFRRLDGGAGETAPLFFAHAESSLAPKDAAHKTTRVNRPFHTQCLCRRIRTGVLCAGLAAFMGWAGTARAILFDWDDAAVNWTAGSLSQSFDFDSSNPGNDITITITGDTSEITSSSLPNDTTSVHGGYSPAQESLFIQVNWNSKNDKVVVTVTFHYAYGVDNVQFQIFDIDAGSVLPNGKRTWQDEIRTIKANYFGGSDIAADSVTGSGSNSVIGSGLSISVAGTNTVPNTGAGSGNGNATISFGGNDLTEFTFTYGSGPDSHNDPSQQHVGLIFDISFTPLIPEYHPGLAATALCGLLGVSRWLKRRFPKG